MKGRRTRKDRGIVIAITAALVLLVGAFCGMLSFQNEIRSYRNQIRFLDPSWMCVAEYQGTKVVLASDNQKKLLNVLDRCSRKAVWKEPETTDTVYITFRKDGVVWEMEIARTAQNVLKLDLTGEDEYHMYVPETNYFDTIVEIVSPEGKGTPNKAAVIGEQ